MKMIVEITGTFHNHIHFNKRIELKLICINIAMQLYDQRIYDWQMANVFSKWFSQYMFSGAKVIGSFRGKAFSPKFRFLVFYLKHIFTQTYRAIFGFILLPKNNRCKHYYQKMTFLCGFGQKDYINLESSLTASGNMLRSTWLWLRYQKQNEGIQISLIVNSVYNSVLEY